MRTLTETEFLKWAGRKQIVLDDRYPESASLTFRTHAGEDRFWCIPAEPQRRPYLIASLLEFMGGWDSCYAWRHLGAWPEAADQRRVNDIVEFQILKGLGLPLGTSLVLKFSREEEDLLITLLFSTSIFGWCVNEDLYVVPDHGKHILQTDHHGVIHVSFQTGEEVEDWVSRMSERGFHLPDDVPDKTFKRPDWI